MTAPESIESKIQKALIASDSTLALAESCTGGLVGHRLTQIAGSSLYFVGGIISYADRIKRDQLDVPQADLEQYGAVSEQVALGMARGVRKVFNTDFGLSVTGIAGPDGGNLEKPVGLTWIAASHADRELVEQYLWDGNRYKNKAASAEAALVLLFRLIESGPWMKPS
jgi:PncC family amidohydrolase